MTLPRNAAPIVNARLAGKAPARGVVVSYVGETPIDAPHVYCDSGKRYDWGFLTGLQTFICARPGVNCVDAIQQLFARANVMRGYPVLIDIQNEHMAYIVAAAPLRLWQVARGSEAWAGVFPWAR